MIGEFAQRVLNIDSQVRLYFKYLLCYKFASPRLLSEHIFNDSSPEDMVIQDNISIIN
jgi:hypothetical protein